MPRVCLPATAACAAVVLALLATVPDATAAPKGNKGKAPPKSKPAAAAVAPAVRVLDAQGKDVGTGLTLEMALDQWGGGGALGSVLVASTRYGQPPLLLVFSPEHINGSTGNTLFHDAPSCTGTAIIPVSGGWLSPAPTVVMEQDVAVDSPRELWAPVPGEDNQVRRFEVRSFSNSGLCMSHREAVDGVVAELVDLDIRLTYPPPYRIAIR